MISTTASVDIMSGGRLVCALALGYRDVENEALGSPPRQRVGRFNEALQIVTGLWSGESFRFDGRYYQIPECQGTLLPVQRPHPPFWIAANNDPAIKRAARLADSWLISPHSRLSVVKRQMDIFRAARAAAGQPFPTTVPIRRDAFVAPTQSEAREHAERYLGDKYETYRQWGQDRALPADDRFSEDFAELSDDRFLIGTPEKVRDDLARYQDEVGITDVVLRLDPAGMPLDLVERSLRLFGEKVLPAFATS
jgi:alkanesulfonate monooxygenase SsuD/methylene tetrahydromethanopterin reductase-like flavin-dependent oxidoreductase (luciferase family)